MKSLMEQVKGQVVSSAVLGILLFGCTGKAKPYAEVTPQPVNPSSVTEPAPPNAPADLSPTPTGNFDSIADSLKNDAFHYYGLSSSPKKTYQLQFSHSPSPSSTQIVTITPTKLDPATVTFDEAYSGMPASTQTMSLDQNGIYVESLKPQILNTPHSLELPAKLEQGVQWTAHQSVNSGTQSIDQTLQYKVIGIKPIQTSLGKFQALYVLGEGTGKVGTVPARMKVESWYVKDLGMVRRLASISGKGIDSKIDQVLVGS